MTKPKLGKRPRCPTCDNQMKRMSVRDGQAGKLKGTPYYWCGTCENATDSRT